MTEVAKSAGFCFGVKRAVRMAYANVGNSNVFTYGNIINNSCIVDDLQAKGLKSISNLSLIPDGSIVIIRAHGISRNEVGCLEFSKRCRIIDATCPYVKKIHSIVQKQCIDGREVVVVGDRSHPEVRGIKGWCSTSVTVVEDERDDNLSRSRFGRVAIVSQTTMVSSIFQKVVDIVSHKADDIRVFDTICSETMKRQVEATAIAKRSNVMFIVGSEGSANTNKLVNVCLEHCSKTFRVNDAGDLQNKGILKDVGITSSMRIGVTAGASTPVKIIKEVVDLLEGEKMDDESFEEAFEGTLKRINTGDIVKGIIISVNQSEVRIDLGVKSDGIIPISELSESGDVNIRDFKVGQELDVFVLKVNDAEGVIILSKKKVDALKAFEEITEAVDDKKVLVGRVSEIVNKGIIAKFKGISVFIPASHVAERFTKDLNSFLNLEVSFRILEVNIRHKKAVGSIKLVKIESNEQKVEDFWENVQIDNRYHGVVKVLTSFGAFVDIGGVDGLLHISELSWNKIEHPSEVVSVGDEIDVYIKSFNRDRGRISLGFRKSEDSPWFSAVERFKVGDIVKCEIIRLVPFGAFAQILPNLDGLIHESVEGVVPSDKLSIGQEVDAKIIKLDAQSQQILLSLRIDGSDAKDKD